MKLTAYASGSTGNLYSVTDGITSLLLEAGLPLKEMQRITQHTLSNHDACFITHAHRDHCEGAKDLQNTIGVPVFCSEHTAGTLDAFTIRIKAGEIKRINTIEVEPFDVKHFDQKTNEWMPTLGFHLSSTFDRESIVFITDTYYSKPRFYKPTIMAIECNYANDLLPEDIIERPKRKLYTQTVRLPSVFMIEKY